MNNQPVRTNSFRPSIATHRAAAAVCLAALVLIAITMPGCNGDDPGEQQNPPASTNGAASNDTDDATSNDSDDTSNDADGTSSDAEDASNDEDENVITLFDGKTLGKWKKADFGGQGGAIEIKDGALLLNRGDDLTGVVWQGEPPARMNYEIELKAKRFEGIDFFCGLTVPVNDRACSLIVGGWSGSIVGISSLEFQDAANNETTHIASFENDKWYHIRMRVTPNKLEVWIDYEKVVDTEIDGRDVDTRPEVDATKPLGLCTWQTGGAIKDMTLRKLEE